MRLNKRTAKRIKNLGEICEFDIKNKTATLTLHFQNASEIIDQKIGTKEEPALCLEALKILENGLDIIPREFNVNFRIIIEDYENYTPETLQNAYHKATEKQKYKQQLSGKHQRSKMGKFISLGLFLLLPTILSTKYSWFTIFGIKISIIIAFILEFITELFFEEGLAYFTVTHIYTKLSRDNHQRIGTIYLDKKA